MKNGKNPTRSQKDVIQKNHLNYANWLVIKDTSCELLIQHRVKRTCRHISKKKEKST